MTPFRRFQALPSPWYSPGKFPQVTDEMDNFCEQVETLACFPASLTNYRTAAVMGKYGLSISHSEKVGPWHMPHG